MLGVAQELDLSTPLAIGRAIETTTPGLHPVRQRRRVQHKLAFPLHSGLDVADAVLTRRPL